MTLLAALEQRRRLAARNPHLRYSVRRSARRSLRVSPFYVAAKR